MALTIIHNNIEFGVGDKIKVFQKIIEGSKERSTIFEGQVISIRGKQGNHSFVVRKIGSGKIGIEKIYPLESPTIEKVEVVKNGRRGVKSAKLFYIRNKPPKEIEKIFSRNVKRMHKTS